MSSDIEATPENWREIIRLNDDGLVPDRLRDAIASVAASGRRIKFLYTIPSYHNPAGVTLTPERRREVLEICREADVLIIEDDPYGLLGFNGEVPRAMRADDPERVIYLGSFSKTFAPGFRVGGVLDPLRGDAQTGQRVLEQVEGAAVEARGDRDGAPGVGEIEDRQRDRGLPGGDQQPGRAALERRDTILDRALGGVVDARVDRPRLGEGEAVRSGFRRREHEAGGLMDRQGTRSGLGIGLLARVDGEGLELLGLLGHGRLLVATVTSSA